MSPKSTGIGCEAVVTWYGPTRPNHQVFHSFQTTALDQLGLVLVSVGAIQPSSGPADSGDPWDSRRPRTPQPAPQLRKCDLAGPLHARRDDQRRSLRPARAVSGNDQLVGYLRDRAAAR